MSVQPAKPVLLIRLLSKELPNVYVFSAHKIFTTLCTVFPNKISHFKILAMPLDIYALFIADTNPREPCVSHSLEIRNTFLILSY